MIDDDDDRYRAVLSCGAVYYAEMLMLSSTFRTMVIFVV